jgi:hypothetical protein
VDGRDSGTAIIVADLDLAEIPRANFDIDIVGYPARPDVVCLVVNTATTPIVLERTRV